MNFLFDVPEKLESNGVELVPFVVRLSRPSCRSGALKWLTS